MKMNDNTILRIKVPAHLYEAVKAQLTLNEAKGKHNLGAGMEVVKEKKAASDKPKAPKKANAPQKATGAIYDKETSKLGAGVSETKKTPKDGHKKMGLEELKALAEMLKSQIAEMEKHEEEKAPVEEEKKEEMEEGKEDIKEYEYAYKRIDGVCYRVTDEGYRTRVDPSYCN